jgi:uncharacterized protein with HEPN domain
MKNKERFIFSMKMKKAVAFSLLKIGEFLK